MKGKKDFYKHFICLKFLKKNEKSSILILIDKYFKFIKLQEY